MHTIRLVTLVTFTLRPRSHIEEEEKILVWK